MRVDDKYKVKGYYPTIGIECHVQLKTRSKLFSTESNDAKNADPNTLIGHVSFGLPGALPVLNEKAVELAVKAAFALHTVPQKFSKFDRKHYFYPDLPKGYQISQYDEPIIIGGYVEIKDESGVVREIAVTRAHLEEDAGKSIHPSGVNYSLVDLNRAGTPLLEIVSEPVIHSATEAKAYAQELWLAMKAADVSDVDLYYGNMRFDVNVSVSKDPEKLGTRTETKNLNSFRSIERAILYEIDRQIGVIEAGNSIVQETRGWLDDEQKTVSQRSKENAHDYRYFPDPDLPPIVLTDEYIDAIRENTPTLPNDWRTKCSENGLGAEITQRLVEAAVTYDVRALELITGQEAKKAKTFANWFLNIETPLYNTESSASIDQNVLSRNRDIVYNSVYDLVSQGKLSSTNAKILLTTALCSEEVSHNISKYADEHNLIQVSDDAEIIEIVKQVIHENPKAVADIKAGQHKAIGYLVGQTMKLSKGKANPTIVEKIINEQLGVELP